MAPVGYFLELTGPLFILPSELVVSAFDCDCRCLGTAVSALHNLEDLTLLCKPKLPVRNPLWSCNIQHLAQDLSRM